MAEALNITTAAREDNQLDLTIEIGPERTEEALQRAAKKVSKRVRIPGFRPGKAPYAHVLRTVGREALLNEILDEIGQEVYTEALGSEKIDAYGQPDVQEVKLDPFSFKMVVPLPPSVELGDYKAIRLSQEPVTVTDEDIEGEVARARSSKAEWQVVERPAEMGDTVSMDIHGTVGEDTIMDNTDWELVLKEESGWLPGFSQAFVGVSAGEEKSFTLRYPEESTSRFKGQEAEFKATIKQVKARVEPEMDDEFARSLGEFESLDDLRTKIRTGLTEQREHDALDKLSNDAIQALVDGATLSYPPAYVDEVVEELEQDLRQRLSRMGYSLEDYLKLQQMTSESYRTSVRPQAEQRAKGRLVLGKLAEVEGITVSREEEDAEIERMVADMESEEQQVQWREMLTTDAARRMLRNDVLTRKTLERLREIAGGDTKEAGAPATPAPKKTRAKAKAKEEAPAAEEQGEEPPAAASAATETA